MAFLLQNSKKQLNVPIPKRLSTSTNNSQNREKKKINGFLLMTHIRPLWWSKAMDYIFLSFLPSACHRTTTVIASFVVKNVTPVFSESLKVNTGKVVYTCHLDQIKQRSMEIHFSFEEAPLLILFIRKWQVFVPNGLKFK